MTIDLSTLEPFAKGGNRLCYVHPDDIHRVIKVRRPDRSLEKKRQQKSFPKNLKPLSSLDDNIEENNVMAALDKHIGSEVYQVVSQCFGFEETSLGAGLVSELIRDDNQKISHTLKQYIWDHGFTDDCQQAVATFSEKWIKLAVPSRDLLLHNIVAQRDDKGAIKRLVVIDGLGSPNIIPAHFYPKSTQRNKAEKKIAKMAERIDQLISQRGADKFPGYHGLLIHDGDTSEAPSDPKAKPE